MSTQQTFKIVDLFAGPGGLGEGFSSHPAFRIAVSAEMEASAHRTLRLRAFYRILKRAPDAGQATTAYFDICNGKTPAPISEHDTPDGWSPATRQAWQEACHEALKLTLGDPDDNARLDSKIVQHGIDGSAPWVLIGGPPCQAYSLVGRSRNMGKADYKAEDDHRHFLYREYLRIIRDKQPAIFVMENVKGILSSKVGGQKIFHNILQDLAGCGYSIHSLVNDTVFREGDTPETVDSRDFIVRAENYGVPQARHRVILLGIRRDLASARGKEWRPPVLTEQDRVHVKDVIGDLPKIRSHITKQQDSAQIWLDLVRKHAMELAKEAKDKHNLPSLAASLESIWAESDMPGSYDQEQHEYLPPTLSPESLCSWYSGNGISCKLVHVLNHEARGHMASDLRRYLYAATFARKFGDSPKGHKEFALEGLAPQHENWESGKFSDRFRVQLRDRPSTTVTSHIAKDGHYFIHYDPQQCRSLTVREAARLQTFPDDYFFQGNRTQQFHQVGNAVPPYLARQIADVVASVLTSHSAN